jgi:REP element-mobilizing transposase RayT
MKNKLAELSSDCFYHIYNRANGNERIFLSGDNYSFFLKKYMQYIDPIAHTYCYCLMPNHFHFLIQIKNEEELKNSLQVRSPAFPKFQTLEKLTSKQFANLFSSYTQAFNKQQGRRGSLFIKTVSA